MKIPKLNLSFSKLSGADFLNKAQFILLCMTNNVFFPNPIPSLANIIAAIIKYSDDLAAAEAGTYSVVALKNGTREELEDLLYRLGLFVMLEAKGNLAVLSSTGFTLTKAPEPSYITNPGNVTLSHGMSTGEMQSQVANVKGCKLYLHQICDEEPNENTVWDSRTCSRSSYMFKGLVPGKKYWVRVAVTGSGEQIAYSTIASMYVS